MVLIKDITSNVLQRNLSELILLVTTSNNSTCLNDSHFQCSTYAVNIPDSIEIIEAATDNPLFYRRSEQLTVTDGRNLIYFPVDIEHQLQHNRFSEINKRQLHHNDPEDKKVIRKLIEKALDIAIRKTTEKRMLQGIYLLEDPISLYRCEKAKLYLGFSLRVKLQDSYKGKEADGISKSPVKTVIETIPQAYIRESVLDYVNFRRQGGASANAIVKTLTTYRNKVVVAPSGTYGSIVDVIMQKAGSQKVSDTDNGH
jgi:hypothetical protein